MPQIPKREAQAYVNYSLDPGDEELANGRTIYDLRELSIDVNQSPISNQPLSPSSIKTNLTYPKRKYSLSRDDSLEQMETPVFTKKEITKKNRKKGPSSMRTVLAMAVLFIGGILLMVSGIIILTQQEEQEFIITGSVFVSVGFLMFLICIILQRKNLMKFIFQLNQDLYFLKMGDSQIWSFMFNAEGTSKYERPYHR
uniref:Transmembrane protein 186 n=1 Tax=Rhabditophanes sp. KR3021 TaxID=114890 RepID=A0AC35U7X9_9BILA